MEGTDFGMGTDGANTVCRLCGQWDQRRLKGESKGMRIVESVNGIQLNVWAIVIMTGGVALALNGEEAMGGTLITGGFALLRDVLPKEEGK